ncbi:Gfo/Idh/MocA family protein [Consotaella salsifontis]|uniref:Predicted dehydrogenase n=1 Tax=Consotaella salsifontis TaxID=1365950 RepID=A0A1T4PRL6_9HYPH|nr:Gfo/Idh/MocA family oxidoreductase [Consotaella salsifontis]SJZ93837.1 Predicted dehydrogenase [Consotaella salsifontis]
MTLTSMSASLASSHGRPRVGFLGVGWIGRHRLEAMAATGAIDVAAIADPSSAMVEEALAVAPGAQVGQSLDDLLAMDLDGVVIATPSALHAEQSIAALEQGLAVFCQKPLGRTHQEVAAVIEAARAADRLLGVDLSYRQTAGMEKIRSLVQGGELGSIFAVDLVFHNAYGPDKDWFYDKARSGGGCVMDLGVHLVDLALWTLGFPAVSQVDGRLFRQGERIASDADEVEDFALATIELGNGAVVRLACSWRLQAGCDAVIGASFHGTGGGAEFRNVNGSFYDFVAERFRGTAREPLAAPPDEWGGRAASAWAERLAQSAAFDPACETLEPVASVLDAIYGR